jgi:hypothetical protein
MVADVTETDPIDRHWSGRVREVREAEVAPLIRKWRFPSSNVAPEGIST